MTYLTDNPETSKENRRKPATKPDRLINGPDDYPVAMRRHVVLAIVVSIGLLVGAAGTAAATPGEGPPDDLPEPVPDFVSELLGAISSFVDGAIDALGGVVSENTPGAAALHGPVTP